MGDLGDTPDLNHNSRDDAGEGYEKLSSFRLRKVGFLPSWKNQLACTMVLKLETRFIELKIIWIWKRSD